MARRRAGSTASSWPARQERACFSENDEIEALTRRAASAASSLRVIAQVGRPSTRATVQPRQRALAAGADAVAAYVPWFYPVTQVQVRDHFLAVLEAAGDAPAFLYNIPPRTVNDLEPALAAELTRRVRGDEGLHGRPRCGTRRTWKRSTATASSRFTPAPSR